MQRFFAALNDKKRTPHDKRKAITLKKILLKRYRFATGSLLSLLIMSTLSSFITHAQVLGNEWGPWDRDSVYAREEGTVLKRDGDTNLLSSIAVFPGIMLISFFQTVISPVDGATCDFYPTCSAYAKQALQKHGLFMGLVMASERLCRYHTYEGYEPVLKFGRYYSHDPLENNDFWFTHDRATAP